jgi:hypothetical protein
MQRRAFHPRETSVRAWTATLCFVVVSSISSAAIALEPPLAEFAGQWMAEGEARPDYAAPFEPGFCSIDTVFDGNSISNRGRCWNEATGFEVAGHLTSVSGGWDGGFFAIVGATALNSAVTFREDGIQVDVTYAGRTDDEIIDARVWLTYPENNRYGFVVEIRHPDTGVYYPVSRLTFVRQ